LKPTSEYTLVNEMKSIIDGFPKTAHPMGVLSLTSALTAFNPKSVNVEKRNV
jgi:citrate synthase